MMSVLLLQPRYLVLSNSFPAHCGGIIDDMASLAVETSREAAKSPLLLNRVDSNKKKFFKWYFFFKSRIKYFNFFLEIQNNDLLIHLLRYLFLLWIQQVVYIILKKSGKSFTGSVNLKRHNCTVHEGHKDHKCES